MQHRWLLCASVVLALAGSARGQTLKIPLKLEPFASANQAQMLSMGGIYQSLPGQGENDPTWEVAGCEGKPTFMLLRLGDNRHLMAALGKAAGAGENADRLWLDLNGDGRSSDEEAFAGKKSGAWLVFGPIEVPASSPLKMPPFQFIVEPQSRMGFVVPAGMMAGEAMIGGRAVKLAVVDRNLNGVYSEVSGLTGEGDGLAVDFDGNGKFNEIEGGNTLDDIWKMEYLPLTHLVQMGDGSVWRLNVASAGDSATLIRFASGLGKVRIGHGQGVVVLTQDKDILLMRMPKGEAAVPAGRYTFYVGMMTERDRAGKPWGIQYRSPDAKGRAIAVVSGTTLQARVGAPLKARLNVQTLGVKTRAYNFSIKTTDCGGNVVSGIYNERGQRPPATQLIVKKAGRVIYTGTFQYGWGGSCSVSWKPNANVKGAVTATSRVNLGPYGSQVVTRTLVVK